MKASDGPTHKALTEQIDLLANKKWPAATLRSSHLTFELTYKKREKFMMVSLDYPGEVFRRAFMEDITQGAERELLNNIDQAAGVLALVDPGVMLTGSRLEQADQDFGLVQAIERIHSTPGGEWVPIAIVLTKCDRYKAEIMAGGGLGRFVKDRYPNLCRVARGSHSVATIFPCSAIRCKTTGLGQEVPDLAKPPWGLEQPLMHCVERIRQQLAVETRDARLQAQTERAQEISQANQAAEQHQSRLAFWVILIGIVVVVGGAIVAWKIFNR